MRITKKVVSIILAIMMVASMMAVGVVSASAATYKVKTAQALLDKVASAASGDIIQLAADIDFSAITTNRNAHDTGDEVKVDLKDLTLNLNGKKITTVNASVVFTGNGAIIKNGSFALNHVKADGTTYQAGSYGLCIDGYGVENGITLTDLTVEGGINIWDADVDIYNVTATATESNFYALWAEGNSNVIVNSGTFSDNGSSKAKGPIATEKSGTGTLVTVKGGTFNATNKVVNAAAPGSVKFEGGTTTKAVPAAYCADGFEPKDNGDGTYGVDCPYEAEVNGIQYETLDAAIAAAPAGATVKLLADIDFSKVTTNRNAHDTGAELKVDLKDLTLDLNGHTITSVNASVVFTGNGATIENGNFALKHVKADGTTYQAGSYGLCIDGYGVENSITLNDLTVEGGINIWDADVEINDVTATATASNFYAIWAEGNSNVTVNSGTFSDNGSTKARGPIATDSTGTGTLVTVKDGTFNATNKVVNAAAPGSVKFEGGTFDNDSAYDYIADGAFVTKNADGSVVVSDDIPTTLTSVDASDFNLGSKDINNYEIFGFQIKEGTGVRFVTAVNEGFLKGANIADYGYVLAKASGLTQAGIGDKFSALQYNGGNGEHTVSCMGTSNTLSGDYGKYSPSTTYKFVTAAVENMNDEQAVARFYIKTTDGNVYYANYINGTTYGGLLAELS